MTDPMSRRGEITVLWCMTGCLTVLLALAAPWMFTPFEPIASIRRSDEGEPSDLGCARTRRAPLPDLRGDVGRAEVVLSTPDATVRRYTRTFDSLEVELTMWDESEKTLRAEGVSCLEDDGTHECDGLIRVPELDRPDEGLGYGIVDTEGNVTLRFRAREVD